MKINEEILRKYAKLAVVSGANVQEGQFVVISSDVEHYKFVELLVEEAYKAKAGQVYVNWYSEKLTKMDFENVSIDKIKEIPDWSVERYKYFIDNKCCFISIDSNIPGLLDNIDPDKLQGYAIASSTAMKPYRYYTMANYGQWTIVALPNLSWAKKVFKDMSDEDALQALWDNILKMVYVDETNDPIKEWDKHNEHLKKYYTLLNNENFKTLHFMAYYGKIFWINRLTK